MADATTQEANQQNSAPRFTVRGQYIKDLSFESPEAPASLMPKKAPPKISVNIDLGAQKLNDNLYESAIKATIKAQSEETTLFVVELEYAGLFELANIPEERIEPMLFIDCPFVIFPFARRVIADTVRDGGFPPLMLEPVDFHQLYARRKAADQKQGEKAAS